MDTRGHSCYNGTNHITNAPALLMTAGGVRHSEESAMSTPSISPENPQLKRCTKCGELKPREAFFANKKASDGKRAHCKACDAARQLKWRADNPNYFREWGEKNRERVRAKKRVWDDANRDKTREYSRRDKAKNREKRLEETQIWRSNNREHTRAYSRQYRIDHADEVRAYNAEYRRTRRAQRYINEQRRLAYERAVPFEWTKKQWMDTLAYFGGCCAACGRPRGLWHTIAADHWIPVSSPNCPGTVPHNMIPLCHGVGGCNNIKNDKPAGMWLAEQFGKRKGKAIQRRIEAFLESQKPEKERVG
jgi:hypothetical protein